MHKPTFTELAGIFTLLAVVLESRRAEPDSRDVIKGGPGGEESGSARTA